MVYDVPASIYWYFPEKAQRAEPTENVASLLVGAHLCINAGRRVSEDKEVGRQQGERRARKCLDTSIAIVIRSEDRSPVKDPLSAKAGGSGSITLVRSFNIEYILETGECYQKSPVVVGLYSLSMCFSAFPPHCNRSLGELSLSRWMTTDKHANWRHSPHNHIVVK